jgi:hypothetical protein
MMLFNSIFCKPRWDGKDDFPSSPKLKEEIEKWLIFMKKRHNNQLEKLKPRLNAERHKRDEALDEIFSAYLIENIFGYPILQWDAKTINNRDVDFIIYNEGEIYCEVKSPGWESELGSKDVSSKRKLLPKHINGETRTLGGIRGIMYSIEKSYNKFLPNCRNLLIIKDDFFSPILDNIRRIDIALFHPEKGCFYDNRFENLGGIIFLNMRKLIGIDIFEYRYKFVKNNNSKVPFSLLNH